jgi:hypothetical protein
MADEQGGRSGGQSKSFFGDRQGLADTIFSSQSRPDIKNKERTTWELQWPRVPDGQGSFRPQASRAVGSTG